MGSGGVIIILKVAREALSVGLNKSGSVKLWHAVAASCVVSFLVGLAL